MRGHSSGRDTLTFILENGREDAKCRLLLAHGAGAGASSPFLESISELIAQHGIGVSRFEFAYMASRRTGGSRRPPPRAEALMSEYRETVEALLKRSRRGKRLIVGGKSLGGRVASLVADELYGRGDIAGLVCLGYPFHPPGKPDQLRTKHLEALQCPTLIVQGDRDPFGNRDLVATLALSKRITFAWMSDGDHDFGPRGRSGFTRKGNLADAAAAVAAFAAHLTSAR